MSYESTKTSSNLGASETMASDMPSQSNNTNFYTNNTNRNQVMMMNPMVNAGSYYNGPAGPPQTAAAGTGPPPTGPTGQQQNQSANRPMYQSYPPSTAPHPPHHQQSQHHQISSSTNNNNHDMNATDSTPATHDQHQMQTTGSMSMPSTQTSTGNGGYNPSMMPPPHPASKQQTYPNYSPQQQQAGDMYSRTTTNAGGSQYMAPYSHYPNAGAPMMNPRSPATNTNVYRPPYPSGPPYQNGIGSPSGPSGKSAIRPQQVSPKRTTSQPTTPPQRYQNPYPNYTNGPVAYKPGGSNGYAAVPPQQQQQPGTPQQQTPSTQQQQQQGPPQSWPPPSNQRDVATPSLASSTGDSDSNSSSASQQAMPSYPPTAMTNGPTAPGYPPHVSNPYNPTGTNDSNNNSMNSTGHHYMDQPYSNIPPPNYGYPPQQMNPYGSHPQQGPPNMHGPPTGEFRPPNTQSMEDENNPYRNKMPSGMMMDPQQQQQQQQQQHHHPSSLSQSHSVSSSTNGPKSPSGTSMSSYVPDEGESSNSSFADSPPPSNEKGHSKRKFSSASSNAHGTPAEVFTKLREMGDESERQDRHIFVDRLQKLWEEHQIVCRNLPSISKQTIDLYRLYTCVREQNGFQEFSKVAKNRHWRDIAAKLNIPNSSSAAFNVKQKYINLKLFHYECKFDRGGINPEPILAEIDKPQGKRAKTPKKGSSNSGSTGNNSNDGSNDGKSSSSLSSASNAQPPNAHGQQQAPSSGPPGQQQMPNPGVQDPYRGYPPPPQSQGHPPHPHPMGHPQGGYRPMPMPMHPYGSTGNEMQQPYDPSVSGQMVYNNPEMDYQRAGYPPPGQQQQQQQQGPPQMMKGPGNAYGMAPPGAQIPQHGPPPPGGMPPQHRPPAPYPSIATKPQQHQQQQQQQQMVPPTQADYGVPPQGATVPGAQPNPQAPAPTGHMPQQTYHYPPQQAMPSAYPPSAGYPQQRPPGMGGPPAPPNVQSSPHDSYMTAQVPPNSNYPSPTPMNYPYKKPENPTPDPTNVDNQDPHKGNKLLMNQLRAPPANTSTLPTSSPISILTSTTAGAPAMSNITMTPSAVPNTPFPPNSVEATTIPLKTKRKKLTAKDVTPVDPWKLMMSLRGGLLAETTWALDTINVMLADDQTHSHFRLKQMPGLLQAVIDVYLKCLTELFDEFKSSSSNIENQQPSLDELNGSSHLTCNTIKKVTSKLDESIAYRVESNYLNKYRRKYQKQQSIVYDQVYDEQGNEKKNPMNVLDLQNTDDFCYVRTHFDPLRYDDNFYEKLYYGHRSDECSTSLTSDELDHEPMKKSQISSRKRTKTTEGDMSTDDVHVNDDDNDDDDDEMMTKTSPKRRRHHSDSMTEISDSNKEFLERYKRKFEFDERISHELYPGINLSTSLAKSTTNLKITDVESCSNSSEQQENASSLFTYHSLAYDQICARCTCVSSILRNLSFIAGNDIELVKSKTLIGLLARLLLLRHGIHQNTLSDNHSSHDETVEQDQNKDEEKKASPSFSWAECVMNIRENTLVTLANIAGALVLDTFDSDLLYTLIDGLLHWSTCYSGEAIDSLHSSLISAQRLAIEILTKLSVHEMNMDFILATPPFYRIVSLFHVLTDWLIVDDINGGISNWHPPTSTHFYSNLSRPQSHIQREFSIVLLNGLTRCDPLAANVIARIPYAISLLINFIEDYEIKTNELMARYGPDYVIRLTTQQSNAQHAEQILFTTGDMLKRAATCLLSIVNYSDNVKMMKRYEDRILNLSISHVIDSNVGRVLTDVLHYCSLHNS